LNGLLYDSNPGLANAAYEALRQLGDDQSKSVSEAASKSLTAYDRAQRQLRMAALYEHAQMSIQAEEWQDAHSALTELIGDDVQYKDASTKLRFVESRIKVNSLYDQALEHHKAEQWQAVLEDYRQIKALEPEFKDSEGIFTAAEQAMAEGESREDIGSVYALGIQYYQAKQFDLALTAFQRVQAKDSSYQNTQRYIQVIKKEIARQKQSTGQPKRKLWPIILGGCGSLACIAACIFIWWFNGY